WYAVEATLRSLARQQQRYRVASSEAGYFERARAQVAGYTITAVSMQRLRAAAQPLIASLSEEQKESRRSVLSSIGVSVWPVRRVGVSRADKRLRGPRPRIFCCVRW